MSELDHIRTRIDELAKTLDRLAGGKNELCENRITGGVAAGAYPGLAELEEVRAKAEDIKRDLSALKNKGRLDPEVRDLENKLEQVLNRYYWLWQKCKDNMA
jgi:predicted nuclease with TOPRIM domain